jgi:hypothetical protein
VPRLEIESSLPRSSTMKDDSLAMAARHQAENARSRADGMSDAA